MSIIISENGQNAQRINKSEIEKESYLQQYIHDNPESIPVYEIAQDKKLLVVAREFSTQSGPIDALAVDKDGDIYVVETKLYKNPDKRTVVAQALDYGASLWRHSSFDYFLNKINSEINNKFKISVEDKIKDFFEIDDDQIVSVFESMKRNLQVGNIKFVILMDAVEERLKDLIVYINQNSQFDIYGVQMEYYKFEQYEIIIPKLFGVEVKKTMTSNTARTIKNWTLPDFLMDAKNRLATEQYLAVEKLCNFSKDHLDKLKDLSLGNGQGKGTINPVFSKISKRKIYGLDSDGKLGFNPNWALSEAHNDSSKNKINLACQRLRELGLLVSGADIKGKNEIDTWYKKVDDIIIILSDMLS